MDLEKPTFISSVSPYPEEEYYLGKSSWSVTASDWDQRFEVGDVVANPSGSWEPGTAEQYIDQQIATVTTDLTNEAIARQIGDRNLSTQLQSEMATRADQDANLNALINAGIREGSGVEFDIVPTQNSANGITSGGMYSTLKDSNLGFVDDEPTAGSNNLVKSGGVAEKIYGLNSVQTTNVKQYSIITSTFAISQIGNAADVFSCSVEGSKRYKIRYMPIFSAGDSTYMWVFTNEEDDLEPRTAIETSELYTQHFSEDWTDIELVAPQFAKTLYIISSQTPSITEYHDVAGNVIDNLNSYSDENVLSANAGRVCAYKVNNDVLSIPLNNICNGEPVVHIDIKNFPENIWIKEKNFENNYFTFGVTDINTQWIVLPEYVPTGRNMIHVKFKVKVERIGNPTNQLDIYISDSTAPVEGSHYTTIAAITGDGEYDLSFDPTYYAIYEGWQHYYIWFWVNGVVTSSQKILFKFYDFQVVEYDNKENFQSISGETVGDLLRTTDDKITQLTSSVGGGQILIAPNGNKYVMNVNNNGTISTIPVIPGKATIFGNSLVSGFSDTDSDVSFGMCASDRTKDFKTLFFNYLSSINPSFIGEKYGAAAFETISNVSEIDYAINAYFLPVLSGNENLIIIELGDNVSVSNESVFAQSSIELLQAIRATCPNARVVWLGIWYGREETYNIIRNACKLTGSEFISLSNIVTSENRGYIGQTVLVGSGNRTIDNVTNVVQNTSTNITITFQVNGVSFTSTMDVVSYSLSGGVLSYQGNYVIVTQQGVASHPGDRGMRAIANKLLYELGIVNTSEYYSLS